VTRQKSGVSAPEIYDGSRSSFGSHSEMSLENSPVTNFAPIYFFFEWTKTISTRKILGVLINLPSGVEGSFQLCVVDGGMFLQLKVEWPQEMQDVVAMHKFWTEQDGANKISCDHPKLDACVQALKALRDDRHSAICSTSAIALPIRVETELQYEPMHWAPSLFLLYVDLNVAADSYSGAGARKLFQNMSLDTQTTFQITLATPVTR